MPYGRRYRDDRIFMARHTIQLPQQNKIQLNLKSILRRSENNLAGVLPISPPVDRDFGDRKTERNLWKRKRLTAAAGVARRIPGHHPCDGGRKIHTPPNLKRMACAPCNVCLLILSSELLFR